MTLSEMLDVFEEMSKLPIKTDDDTLLLDTCYYDPTFSGNIVHNFSLVRQVPDSKGEYYQLRLEITLETQETEISFPAASLIRSKTVTPLKRTGCWNA